MDPSVIIYIIILLLLIGISAICSAAETAFSSANIIRIKSLAKKKDKRAKKAYKLIKCYSKTLTTILVFNNIVNILSTSLATYIFTKYLGGSGVIYATIIMTILILTFGEIIPKILAKEYSEEFAYFISPIFNVLIIILTPITKLVSLLENKLKGKKKNITATEDELIEIIQTVELEGVLNQVESELIQNALEFDDKRIKDVMVDKKDVIFLYDTDSSERIKQLIINQKYSRIPVVCRRTGRVLGIIHEGDLIDDILQGKEISINTLLKDAIYVNKNRKLAYALEKIQKSRMHMAIVIDNNEDHNFLGIVTLEDILEELVGEIYDEYDDLPTNVLEIGLHTFQINPNIEIKTFFNKYLENTNLPNTKAKTFTGWIQELSNGRPKKNQEFNYENIKITILSLDGKIPTKLEVTFTSNYEDDNDLL